AELAMGRTMTSQKTCRLGAQRLTIAPWRESQDPTVTFGGLGLVQAQDEMPSFRAAVTLQVQLLIRQQVRHKQPTPSGQ
ncbi:hypothetical protein, partial [Limnobacter sp.]|uniref:hypothetical protein n=3 Tax=Limnobacter sp. TaxID=2003368 RepID=UPI002ABA8E76|nr:hypothetical protein [Limnobacter sp.]